MLHRLKGIDKLTLKVLLALSDSEVMLSVLKYLSCKQRLKACNIKTLHWHSSRIRRNMIETRNIVTRRCGLALLPNLLEALYIMSPQEISCNC